MNEWEWQLLEDKQPLECLEIEGVSVRRGDRVRLRPRQGGDVLDIALAGQIATIESIEQDYEGKAHICVVLDDDPGRDLGMLRQPGHRFFFSQSEIEPMPQAAAHSRVERPKILVAGIGNIFFGDDAFGVEVARKLASRELPASVCVKDFGIRGFDLAYALQDGYETVILVDAFPRGQAPGTLSLIEPDIDETSGAGGVLDAHGMNPLRVLQLAASMGPRLPKVLLLGCEPETTGGEEGRMGLSSRVETAVNEAVDKIQSILSERLQNKYPGSNGKE